MPTCLVDIRCLQDPATAATPAGHHARALLDGMRAGLPGTRCVAVADPRLPPLAGFDATRTSAYTGALTGPTIFVQLSPMTHDPQFVARLLHHPAIPAATAFLGLGPDENDADRIDTLTALRWLARHQLFLPATPAAAARLKAGLQVPDARIVLAPDAAPFWQAVQHLTPVTAPAVPQARPRVALVGVLPPARSAVADYTAATCAALGRRVELHVVSPTAGAVCPPGAATVRPLSVAPWLDARFDRVVCALGDEPGCGDVQRLLLRHGGAVIQHDGRMLASHLALHGGPVTVARAEAELGRPLQGSELNHWIAGALRPAARLLGPIAASAEPLFMHARADAGEVARHHGRPVIVLPLCPIHPLPEAALTPAHRAAARARLGLAPDEVLLASFDTLRPGGAPLDCVWALHLLRRWGVKARLHFVGQAVAPLGPVCRLLADLRLARHVWLEQLSYADHLLAADVAVQLATGGPGAGAAALADCIAAGLPTVASRSLAAAADAPDSVRTIDDTPSPVLLAEAVAASLGTRPPADARRAWCAAHGFDTYVARLCAALGLP